MKKEERRVLRAQTTGLLRVVRASELRARGVHPSHHADRIAESAALDALHGERGQVLVIGLVVCVALFMISISVANVGIMVAEKIQLQDAVDAAAYSAATVEARYMNLSAYLNRAMIANYDSMAFDTAIWAVVDADDHFFAALVSLLYQIDAALILFPFTTAFGVDLDQFIDLLRNGVHHPLHLFNSELNKIFPQDDDSQDLNQYLELYNTDIISMYHGLLFAAMQASRHDVAQEVAKRIDPNAVTTSVLGLGAEAVSADELAKAVDYIIRDPDSRSSPFDTMSDRFNKMMGTAPNPDDHPLYLAATTEASLDKFTAGRTRDGEKDFLRNLNLGNILPLGALETALDFECEIENTALQIATFGLESLDCDADISLVLGAEMREGQENKANETHVPFIARQRYREVNFFGLDFEVTGTDGLLGSAFKAIFDGLFGARGHTSGEEHNDVKNVANTTIPNAFGAGARFIESWQSNGFQTCALGIPIPTCGLNSMNILEASTMIPVPLFPPIRVDDHWDGSTEDVEPVCSAELIPPGECIPDVIEYVTKDKEAGVPKYDWKVDVDNTGFPLYHYPTDNADVRPAGSSGGGNDQKRILTGPSVAVLGTKEQDKIHGMRGLGIGNEYAMSALARAQVYYLRNPNRPDESPSMFNPHWVPRLAPLDGGDSPAMLQRGLPYVAGGGIGIQPTH